MPGPKRSLKNLVQLPAFQFRFALAFVVVGALMILSFVFVIQYEFTQIFTALQPALKPEFRGLLEDQIRHHMMSLMVFSLGATIFICIVAFQALIFSHKIAGPVVNICSYIDDIIKEDFSSSPRKLRRKDHLDPVVDKLNELAESLQKQKGA